MSEAIRGDAVIRREARVVHRRLQEGSVLLHLDTAAYHSLNETGTAIWLLLESEPPFDGLVRSLEAELDGPSPDLREDIEEFILGLRDRGLVQIRAPGH